MLPLTYKHKDGCEPLTLEAEEKKHDAIHSEITPNMIYCYSWSEVISQMQKFISNLVKTAETFKSLH